jgi:hypothetical protein
MPIVWAAAAVILKSGPAYVKSLKRFALWKWS